MGVLVSAFSLCRNFWGVGRAGKVPAPQTRECKPPHREPASESSPEPVPRPTLVPLCTTSQKFLQILKDVPEKDEGIYSLTAGVAPVFTVGWGSAGALLLVRLLRCAPHPI